MVVEFLYLLVYNVVSIDSDIGALIFALRKIVSNELFKFI